MMSLSKIKKLFILFFLIALSSLSLSFAQNETIVNPPVITTPSPPGLLSFNFQNVEVRTLLQIITKTSGYNFVISDSVTGNMTLNLKDVTWQQALKTILTAKNLSQHRVGNVIFISTADEMAASLAKQMQSRQILDSLEPLETRVIRLKYTNGITLSKVLKGEGASLLTQRGQVSVDLRTNSVIIVDTPKQLYRITRMIRQLDVPAKQVLIEARIVNLDTSFESQLGVRFGITDPTHLTGTLSGANQMVAGAAPYAINPLEQRLNFNGPAAAISDGSNPGSIGLALARLGPILLDLELSAIESEGHGKVISKPRVVTSNLQRAIIQTGVEIPYQEATSSGATSVEFKKAVLSLEVIPQITPNNKIMLRLRAHQDTRGPQLIVQNATTSTTAAGGTISTPAVFGPPTINTQSVESNILLADNETFVVGGVFQLNQTNTVDRIPFFGSLPIVGALFRHKGQKNSKTELLIFITPKIVNKGIV